jgi:hypothetical protein
MQSISSSPALSPRKIVVLLSGTDLRKLALLTGSDKKNWVQGVLRRESAVSISAVVVVVDVFFVAVVVAFIRNGGFRIVELTG